eukprot:439931-Rhodomonas_salina.1
MASRAKHVWPDRREAWDMRNPLSDTQWRRGRGEPVSNVFIQDLGCQAVHVYCARSETSCLEDVDGKPIPNFFEKWQHELALQDAKPCDLRAELASVKPIPANQLQDQCAWIVTALEDFRNRVQDITHRVHEYEAGFTDLEECSLPHRIRAAKFLSDVTLAPALRGEQLATSEANGDPVCCRRSSHRSFSLLAHCHASCADGARTQILAALTSLTHLISTPLINPTELSVRYTAAVQLKEDLANSHRLASSALLQLHKSTRLRVVNPGSGLSPGDHSLRSFRAHHLSSLRPPVL